jgi:hypothetical protein
MGESLKVGLELELVKPSSRSERWPLPAARLVRERFESARQGAYRALQAPIASHVSGQALTGVEKQANIFRGKIFREFYWSMAAIL